MNILKKAIVILMVVTILLNGFSMATYANDTLNSNIVVDDEKLLAETIEITPSPDQMLPGDDNQELIPSVDQQIPTDEVTHTIVEAEKLQVSEEAVITVENMYEKYIYKDPNHVIANAYVPDDFENAIWLNDYFLQMAVGDVDTIFARRLPEIVKDGINNTGLTIPNFNYQIIYGDSIELNEDNNFDQSAKVKAIKQGLSIVKVDYDAVKPSWSDKTYGQSSVVNSAYLIVAVNNDVSMINISSPQLDAISSFDTLYFNQGSTRPLKFSLETSDIDFINVTCNGVEIFQEDGSYTANLENRENIIGIVVGKDGKISTKYYTVNARKIDVSITNKHRPGSPLQIGDVVQISFKGVTQPIKKLAGIYNPMYEDSAYGNQLTSIKYKLNGDDITVKGSQYSLSNAQINIPLDKSGHYAFSDGYIQAHWWGQPSGYHKNKFNNDYEFEGGRPAFSENFGTMPSFDFEVSDKIEINPNEIILANQNVILEMQSTFKLEASVLPISATNKEVAWESSNESIIKVDQNGNLQPIAPGKAEIYVKSVVDYIDVSAICYVQVIDQAPATDLQKATLKNYVAAIKDTEKYPSSYLEKQWNNFVIELNKSQDVLNDKSVLIEQVENQYESLKKAYTRYQNDIITVPFVISEQTNDGTKFEINFPNMVIPDDMGYRTISWHTQFDSDLPVLGNIKTDNLKDNKEQLKTITFTIPSGVDAIFELSNGVMIENYKSHPQFNWTASYEHFKKTDNAEVYLPNIPLKVGEVIDVASIKIINQNVIINNNQQLALQVDILPTNATVQSLIWQTSDQTIATVDENGTVTGVGDGKVVISATAQYTDIQSSIEVEVINLDLRIEQLIQAIDGLNPINLSKEKVLIDALNKYNTLDEMDKSKVINSDKLQKAQADLKSIKQIFNKIDQLSYTVNLLTIPDLIEVIDEYMQLADDLKTSIPNSAKLLRLSSKYHQEKKYLLAAKVTVDLIDQITNVSLNNQQSIINARESYNQLPNNSQQYVYNLDRLLLAEQNYKKLFDQDKAKNVIDKINQIGIVTLEKELLITKARFSYNALNKVQKEYVTNYHKLISAEEKIADLQVVIPVINLIEQIQQVTKASRNNITKIREIYDALSAKQKLLIENYDKLVQAELLLAQIEAYTPEKISEEISSLLKKVTVNNISYDNLDEIMAIYRKINYLSDDEIKEIQGLEQFNLLCDALGKLLQSDASTLIECENMPWYVKLQAQLFTPSQNQLSVIDQTINQQYKILQSVDITFDDLFKRENYQVLSPIKIKINIKAAKNYQTILAYHFADDGRVNIINGQIVENNVVFESVDFSPIIIVATNQDYLSIIGNNTVIDDFNVEPIIDDHKLISKDNIMRYSLSIGLALIMLATYLMLKNRKETE